MAYWRQSVNSGQTEFKNAKRAALRALELDTSSGIAAANVAEILDNEYNFYGALEKIDLALKLEPENPYVLRNAGRLYTILGRQEKAIAFCKSAVEKDPIQRSALVYLARAYYYGGFYEEANQTIKKFMDLYYKSQAIAREYFNILIDKNNIAAAKEEIEKMNGADLRLIDQGLPLYASALVNARLGNKKESDHVMALLIEKHSDNPYLIALAYANIGDAEKVMNWLETSFRIRTKAMVYVNVEPLFKKFKDNNRFKALIQKMNFPK